MKYRMRMTGRFLLLALMLAAVLATAAQAESLEAVYNVRYIERSWDAQAKKVVETEKTEHYCVAIDENTEKITGEYVVNRNVDSEKRLVIEGTASIILCDGARLFLEEGINIKEGNTLNIYCQEGGTGELYCEAHINDNAAIGSDDHGGNCGTINIHGGVITADTHDSGEDAAGIGGGGDGGDGGEITIYGGEITAKGGSDWGDGGAGIGGGGDGGDGGEITIYGGEISAQGGDDGAGIGGGDEGSGGTIRIYGGTVNATGGNLAAGIGSGDADGDNKTGGLIEIYGGDITAKGGIYHQPIFRKGGNCAGIGGGVGVSGGNITIKGGTVDAKGGKIYTSDVYVPMVKSGGAAIGGGEGAKGGNITIEGGTVTAKGGGMSAGIGVGNNGASGTIRISGGTIDSEGWRAAGIGFGKDVDESDASDRILITGGVRSVSM